MTAEFANSGAPAPKLVAAAKWASLVYAGSMLLVWMWMATVDGPGALLFLALCLLWQVAPVFTVALMARASGTRDAQIACLLFGALLIASTIVTYVYCLFIAPDPQLPIFLLYLWPVYQFGAFTVFLVIALLSGWRERDKTL
jgi:hypothetical protein